MASDRHTLLPNLTDLEREVLGRVVRGEDPWGPRGYGGGSRRVSQALGRLRRKGAVDDGDGGTYAPTKRGIEAIAARPRPKGARPTAKLPLDPHTTWPRLIPRTRSKKKREETGMLLAAIVIGFHELSKRGKTLGDRVHFHLLRERWHEQLRMLGSSWLLDFSDELPTPAAPAAPGVASPDDDGEASKDG